MDLVIIFLMSFLSGFGIAMGYNQYELGDYTFVIYVLMVFLAIIEIFIIKKRKVGEMIWNL